MMKVSLHQSLKLGPKWLFLYFKPILVANFVTIATTKVKLKTEFDVPIFKQTNRKTLVKSNIQVLTSEGAKLAP